jgi:hypothetical protein
MKNGNFTRRELLLASGAASLAAAVPLSVAAARLAGAEQPSICSVPTHSQETLRQSTRFNIAPIRSTWTAAGYMGMNLTIGSVRSESRAAPPPRDRQRQESLKRKDTFLS